MKRTKLSCSPGTRGRRHEVFEGKGGMMKCLEFKDSAMVAQLWKYSKNHNIRMNFMVCEL